MTSRLKLKQTKKAAPKTWSQECAKVAIIPQMRDIKAVGHMKIILGQLRMIRTSFFVDVPLIVWLPF
jgi:predicted phage tail protein